MTGNTAEAMQPPAPEGGWPKERRTFWPWRLGMAIVYPVLAFLSKVEYRGLDRIPKSGPVILAPNHLSEIDPLFIVKLMLDAGRLSRFLAKRSIWKVPVVGAAMTASGQIPVERSAGGAASIKAAEQMIASGSAVAVYPEGTLTREPDLWPMRGKTGAARLALESGVPVLPVAHWGVQQVMPRYGKINLKGRKHVVIAVGEPVDLSRWVGQPLTSTTLAEATEAIMQAITELLAELRGETPPAERWDPAKHGQSETGRKGVETSTD